MTSNCITRHKNRLVRPEDFFQSTRQASLFLLYPSLLSIFISCPVSNPLLSHNLLHQHLTEQRIHPCKPGPRINHLIVLMNALMNISRARIILHQHRNQAVNFCVVIRCKGLNNQSHRPYVARFRVGASDSGESGSFKVVRIFTAERQSPGILIYRIGCITVSNLRHRQKPRDSCIIH